MKSKKWQEKSFRNYPSGSLRALVIGSFILLAACGAESVDTAQENMASDTLAEMSSQTVLVPLPGMEGSVPEITRKTTILMRTGTGELTVEIYPEAAPNAAARFVELVEAGFYNNTPVFRVVPDFVVQFGINWREPFPQWQDNNFNDDPTLFALERGTLAFAKAGPDTNSTQVFINAVENNRLASADLNFTVFGKVVSGMEAVDAFIPVGAPGGGLDQERLWSDGAAYLDSLATKPVMIEEAIVVNSPDSP